MSMELIELSNALVKATDHTACVRGGSSYGSTRVVQRRHLAPWRHCYSGAPLRRDEENPSNAAERAYRACNISRT